MLEADSPPAVHDQVIVTGWCPCSLFHCHKARQLFLLQTVLVEECSICSSQDAVLGRHGNWASCSTRTLWASTLLSLTLQ